jgi:hypothetical protein
MKSLHQLMTEHPDSVDESYGEHFMFAMRFFGWLFVASLAALIHAVLPFLFEKTASTIITRLHDRIHNRGATAATADDGSHNLA